MLEARRLAGARLVRTLVDKRLGARLNQARIEEGVLISTLTDMLGISEEAYLDVEAGIKRISAFEVARLARALNRPISWLFDQSPAEVSFPLNRNFPVED